jgi:peptidoglycan/xylan/chitin deacetylase (PgdA/CDA1 family)
MSYRRFVQSRRQYAKRSITSPETRPVDRSLNAVILLLAFAMTVALISCAPAAPTPTQPPAPPTPAALTSTPVALAAVATATEAPRSTATPVPPTPTAVPSATATPGVVFERDRPNELGLIPILAYHLIGEPEGRWQRTPENLRQDLERLYAAKYRLVSLKDILDNRIDIPAGYSPVALTFDDSSPGQFRFVEKNGRLEVDPNSAVGILAEFHRKHPDFGRAATFFVLPAADPPHNLFGQDEYQKEKLKYLIDNGMDIGNHSYWHQELGSISETEVRRQLGMAVKSIQAAAPGYQMDVLALPLGVWPKNRDLVKKGEWEGTTYANRGVLLVGAEPAPPPGHVDYDPFAIPRIQAIEEQLDFWLGALEKGSFARYISDGNPNRLVFPDDARSNFQSDGNYRALPPPAPGYQAVQIR